MSEAARPARSVVVDWMRLGRVPLAVTAISNSLAAYLVAVESPRPDGIPSPYGAAPPRRPGRGRGRRALPAPSPADRAQSYEDFINSLGD